MEEIKPEEPEETLPTYIKLIGEGAFGEVWSAEWEGRLVAAKRLDEKWFKQDYQQEIKDRYINELKRESQVLENLIHPNILRMYVMLFPVNQSPVIITELLHCDLKTFIANSETNPKVPPSKLTSIALEVTEGLDYLHTGLDTAIAHRDISTKNILLTQDLEHAKIADLGVAKVFAGRKDEYATSNPGTPVYSAPETLGNDFYELKYGTKVDIFSLGVVLMVMINGREPHVPPRKSTKHGRTIPERERRTEDIDAMGNHALKELVLDCLHDKGSKRPTAKEIIKRLHKHQQNVSDEGTTHQQQNVQNGTASGNTAKETCVRNIAQCSFEKIPKQHHCDYKFKVLLIGESGVGKTCLVEKLKNPMFEHLLTTSTIGIVPHSQYFNFNSNIVQLEIGDTAGQERFMAVQPMYYRDIHGLFLVYNVMSKETFDKLTYWMNEVKKHISKSYVYVVIVGNKIDCIDRGEKVSRVVTRQQGQEYADKLGYPYVETSATREYSHTILNMYEKMVELLVQTADVKNVHMGIDVSTTLEHGTVNVDNDNNSTTKSKCRCHKSNWS